MDLNRRWRWLAKVFTVTELRRVARLGPAGERVAAALPTAGTLDDLAFEVASTWERHAVDDRALFDHLLAERPSRREELVELWGEAIEPAQLRPDGIQVAINLPPGSELNKVESHQLGVYLGRLAGETVPETNIDIRLTKLLEFTNSVVATVEVVIFGDFAEERVAKAMLNKFHDKPWSAPAADPVWFDHDDQRLCLTAHARVLMDHLNPG